jgi:hypothetical protein
MGRAVPVTATHHPQLAAEGAHAAILRDKKVTAFAKEPCKVHVLRLVGTSIHVRKAVKNCGHDARMRFDAGSRRHD